eukprot:scaffold184_cov316-Pinguiococcus_pyrenoidosus.AAC.38
MDKESNTKAEPEKSACEETRDFQLAMHIGSSPSTSDAASLCSSQPRCMAERPADELLGKGRGAVYIDRSAELRRTSRQSLSMGILLLSY